MQCCVRATPSARQAPSRLGTLPLRTARRPGPVVRAATESAQEQSSKPSVAYRNIMLTILDANPYLSEGSKAAVSTATGLSSTFGGSKITVLIVDEPGTQSADAAKRIETISWHLKDGGCAEFELVEREATHASVLMGDVADEVAADLVLVSSEAVHAKHVDANQLAEFVSCPVLIMP